MIEFGLVTVNSLYRADPPQHVNAAPRLIGHVAWQWDHVREGSMRIFTPRGACDVCAGESVLSPPWLSHDFHWYRDSTASSIHFFWPEAPTVPTNDPIFIGRDDLDAPLRELFFRYAPYSESPERSNAACAFHLLLSTFLEKRFPSEHAPETMTARARRLIEANNYAPVGLAALAEEFHMSQNHFIRCFKAESGITPGQYVLACRLTRATELLRFSDMNITAIALTLGFADLYTFSKAFKRYTGLAPTAWLRQLPQG